MLVGKKSLDVPLTRYDVPTMADTIRSASNVLDSMLFISLLTSHFSLLSQDMWPINASGSFYSQAKVVGGNQATNGMAWFATQQIDILISITSLLPLLFFASLVSFLSSRVFDIYYISMAGTYPGTAVLRCGPT